MALHPVLNQESDKNSRDIEGPSPCPRIVTIEIKNLMDPGRGPILYSTRAVNKLHGPPLGVVPESRDPLAWTSAGKVPRQNHLCMDKTRQL